MIADQEGRIAVIAGGGRGLGRAIALGHAGRGAKVVAVAGGESQPDQTVTVEETAPGSAE